jgi:hypothetical protein
MAAAENDKTKFKSLTSFFMRMWFPLRVLQLATFSVTG